MNNLIQALEVATLDAFAADLALIDDASLEYVGGGTITNML